MFVWWYLFFWYFFGIWSWLIVGWVFWSWSKWWYWWSGECIYFIVGFFCLNCFGIDFYWCCLWFDVVGDRFFFGLVCVEYSFLNWYYWCSIVDNLFLSGDCILLGFLVVGDCVCILRVFLLRWFVLFFVV